MGRNSELSAEAPTEMPSQDLPDGFEWVWNSAYHSFCARRGWMKHPSGWYRKELRQDGDWVRDVHPDEADGVPAAMALALNHETAELIDHGDSRKNDQDFLTICTGTMTWAGNNVLHVLAHRGPSKFGPKYKEMPTLGNMFAHDFDHVRT